MNSVVPFNIKLRIGFYDRTLEYDNRPILGRMLCPLSIKMTTTRNHFNNVDSAFSNHLRKLIMQQQKSIPINYTAFLYCNFYGKTIFF